MYSLALGEDMGEGGHQALSFFKKLGYLKSASALPPTTLLNTQTSLILLQGLAQ